MKNKNTRRGFTLIELLVVVLIIAILAAVALPQYNKAVEKAKAMQALTLGKHLKDLERLYFLANGEYTEYFDQLGAEISEGKLNSTKMTLSVRQYTFSLLENYNRVLIRHYSPSPRYNISINLDSEVITCTAYQDDNYQAKGVCQALTRDSSEGKSGCDKTCRSWTMQ